ncbi:hypothetical protein KI387_016845, partial [Taxus chinensis]
VASLLGWLNCPLMELWHPPATHLIVGMNHVVCTKTGYIASRFWDTISQVHSYNALIKSIINGQWVIPSIVMCPNYEELELFVDWHTNHECHLSAIKRRCSRLEILETIAFHQRFLCPSDRLLFETKTQSQLLPHVWAFTQEILLARVAFLTLAPFENIEGLIDISFNLFPLSILTFNNIAEKLCISLNPELSFYLDGAIIKSFLRILREIKHFHDDTLLRR